MPNIKRNFSNKSYSLKIGPSTYYVTTDPTENLRNKNYSFIEGTSARSKSISGSISSSPRSHCSRSKKRSVSPKHRQKTCNDGKSSNKIYYFDQQEQILNKTDCPHCKELKLARTNQNLDKITRTDQKRMIDKLKQEAIKEENFFIKSIKKGKIPRGTTTDSLNQEIIQLFNEQKQSFTQLIEENTRAMTTSSISVIKQIVIEALKSQTNASSKELQHILIQTMRQELQQLLPKDADKSLINSRNIEIINRLEDLIIQTIEKYTRIINKNNNDASNNPFIEQKQTSFEMLTLQQSIPSIDIIKQVIIDVLDEQHARLTTTNTKINITSPRETHTNITNDGVKINVNLNQTCIDTAFRQQRDTIVVNRYLRDTIRQLLNVRSISSLVKKIQSCGTNDFENAWLLFCWIGHNIFYDMYCEDHSAENVFRNRTGACQGFVNLYYECCLLLNIQCFKISGYVKENFVEKMNELKKFRHSWNAIVIDKYTYLVDPTWGAGANHGTYQFQDCFFLTPADEFIYTHYSDHYQLLQPSISKQEFFNLPIVKSNYYRLNLSLLTPKNVFNKTNESIFKISIKTPAYVDILAVLKIDDIEYSCHSHVLCQHDINQTDVINCFLAPPIDGHYEVKIIAKTNDETAYQDAIYMRLNVSKIMSAVTFPIIYKSFSDYKCILVEPFRRIVQKNENLCIHMKIPNAFIIKIKNGDDYVIPNIDEYKNGLLRKQINVQGDLHFVSTNITNISYTIRIYSNQAEIIQPLDKLPLEFTDDDWDDIRPDSITLLGGNVNILLQTITQQKKTFNGTEVYIRSPISSDTAVKLIKGILIDETNNLVKIQDESIADQQTIYLTVPRSQIYYLEEPFKPKHYVNFSYTASDSNVFVSYLRSNLNWRTQYQLNLNNNQSDLIAMANIRNDGRSSVFIDQAELICGDINLQVNLIQYDRSLRKYRSGNEPYMLAQTSPIPTILGNAASQATVEQGKELVGLYVFPIDKPFMVHAKTNYLLPMFRPQVSVARYGSITISFSTSPISGKAQRSYRLKTDRYLSNGNCIIREYDRVVGEILLPNLAANDEYEFSIGEDADIIYKQNETLISSNTFNETGPTQKSSSDKNTRLTTPITRVRYIYTINLQLKNFKNRLVYVEYELRGFYSYHKVKLIKLKNNQFFQDGTVIKSNLTIEANTTENFSYTVELIR